MSETAVKHLRLPLSDEDVFDLHAGESVLLSGILFTGRDAAHKWMTDTFVKQTSAPSAEDEKTYQVLKSVLQGGAIYHCGPVVLKMEDGRYRFAAAGPTTSVREEPYQAGIIYHFGLKAVIGKGGMGVSNLAACQKEPAVYLHATGGAAALMAACITEVKAVYKIEFGMPEAMWLIQVNDMPLVVSMDAHGNSLHEKIRTQSRRIYKKLVE